MREQKTNFMYQYNEIYYLLSTRNVYKMTNQVKTKFVSKSSSERAQMIATARQYVNNDRLLNLLQNIDINDVNIKNKTTSI